MMVSDMYLWDWFKERLSAALPQAATAQRPLVVPGSLDLHGLTVQQAHKATADHIQAARLARQKSTRIITGKSGTIRQEFPIWMALNAAVSRIEVISGGGAFTVTLKLLAKG